MLKHRLTEPFGKAGLTVAVVALVMALIGGAYAAGGLTKSQEKQVTKIAKKYAGKPGAPGETGPAGTNGTNGKDGVPGAPGAPGTSVTNTPVPTSSATCNHLGGAEFKVGTEAATKACNGQSGFTKTLPHNETETGVWSLLEVASGAGTPTSLALSFNIPLATAPVQKHFIARTVTQANNEEFPTAPSGCTGGTVANPTAEPGNLCVYATKMVNVTEGAFGALFVDPQDSSTEQVGKTGAAINFSSTAAGPLLIWGDYAVTAE